MYCMDFGAAEGRNFGGSAAPECEVQNGPALERGIPRSSHMQLALHCLLPRRCHAHASAAWCAQVYRLPPPPLTHCLSILIFPRGRTPSCSYFQCIQPLGNMIMKVFDLLKLWACTGCLLSLSVKVFDSFSI